MRLRLGSAILVLSVFLPMPAVHAAIIDFTISGGDSGSIAITESAGTITNITGIFDSSTILALLPVSSIGGNDNVYTGTSPYFDGGGVSFSLVSADSYGYTDVNISNAANLPSYAFGSCQGNTPTGGVDCNGVEGFSPLLGDSITLGATPEPSGLILLGIGLVALVGASRFRLFA